MHCNNLEEILETKVIIQINARKKFLALADHLNIEIESEDQSKYSNSFIVIAASHWSRYIWRDLHTQDKSGSITCKRDARAQQKKYQNILQESNRYKQASLIYKYTSTHVVTIQPASNNFTKHWLANHSNIERSMIEPITMIITIINKNFSRKIGRQSRQVIKLVEKFTIAKRIAAVKPAPAPFTSWKKEAAQIRKNINSKNINVKFGHGQTFVRR